MICSACHSADSYIIRTTAKDGCVKRQRQCVTCGNRWFTLEADVATIEKAQQIIDAARHLQELVGEG